jgi:phosphate transport system substrate-binding protein
MKYLFPGAFIIALAVTDAAAQSDAINVKGSDTMVQVANAWAEAYKKVNPNARVSVSGGGSGTGIAALLNGTANLCNSSREMKPAEKQSIKEKFGKDVKETTIGYDALAVYTNLRNPVKQISVEDLTEIWAEGGSIDAWDKINPAFKGQIVRVGRQNNSGTYDYFREHICGKTADGKQREFKPGASELNGSSEVIEQVAKTRTAMGYSGMGYKNEKVNWLAVSKKKGEKGVLPGTDVARSGEYPIARKLYIYTVGEPAGELKAYIDWILGPEGQKVVNKEGFVSLK